MILEEAGTACRYDSDGVDDLVMEKRRHDALVIGRLTGVDTMVRRHKERHVSM
jgi:hypothetical protein